MKRMTFLIISVFLFTFSRAGAAEIEIQAGIFGGAMYQASYGFSELLKKYEPDFKVTIVETPGSAAGIIKMTDKPQTRVVSATYVTSLEAMKGKPPFKKAYTNLRIIGNFTLNVQSLITLNPDIKTLNDLSGKRLGLGPKPTVLGKTHWSIIEKGLDHPDQVNVFYMPWGGLKDALLDGSIDAMILGISTRRTGHWVPVPVFTEILASRGTPQFISIPESVIQAASEADGIFYPPVKMAKDSLAPGMPAKDIMAWGEKLAIFASSEFSEETAYTIAKVLYEHCEEMVKYTPTAKGMWPELVVDIHLPTEMIHPGALKYYKEKGLK